ncbi:MAG: exonuclease [Sphingobacteriales bacterium]|nr:MAG: exonuclease [Sphingobacteriales bacterium]TAF83792.1 MAG: exonuclease [Sphingobacteriales bacterium]
MGIKNNFIIKNTQGLYCPYGDFYLDPQLPVHTAIISHAHNDHAKPGHNQVFCTPPTALIMQLRYKKNAAQNFTTYNYKQVFKIKNVTITFFSAGHILGSAMVLMEYEGIKYLFTGDYKLQADSTCSPIEFTNAHVLITETTFAHPEVIHPNPIEEIKKLNNIKENIMIGAYALGKAQRINKLITEYCPTKKILVHHTILPLHLLYQKQNVDIGKFEPYNRKLMKNINNQYIYLVPPVTFKSYQKADNTIRMFASGWKNLQINQKNSLYISDHVDWCDILLTIEKVKPTLIYTIHGEGKNLQQHYKNKIDIKILDNAY